MRKEPMKAFIYFLQWLLREQTFCHTAVAKCMIMHNKPRIVHHIIYGRDIVLLQAWNIHAAKRMITLNIEQ